MQQSLVQGQSWQVTTKMVCCQKARLARACVRAALLLAQAIAVYAKSAGATCACIRVYAKALLALLQRTTL